MKEKNKYYQAENICKKLKETNANSICLPFFEGVTVIDMLLQREPEEYHIAVTCSPDDLSKTFDVVTPYKKDVVIIEGCYVRMLKDSKCSDLPTALNILHEKALKNLFTIQGVYFDPLSKRLVDTVGGVDDINKRILRLTSTTGNFTRLDIIAIIRAGNDAYAKGFEMDTNSAKAIDNYFQKNEIGKDVLDAVLLAKKPSAGIKFLVNHGLLDQVIPELALLKDEETNSKWHTEGNTFEHSLLVLDAVREDTDDLATLYGALLHDIGKINSSQDLGRYHDHDKKGAVLAKKILKRIHASKEETLKVVFIVKNHMRVKRAQEMRYSKLAKMKSEKYIEDTILVSYKDSLVTVPEKGSLSVDLSWKDTLDNFEFKKEEPYPILNGYDLLGLGLTPGPLYKEILAISMKDQKEGIISTKEEAIEKVKTYVNK